MRQQLLKKLMPVGQGSLLPALSASSAFRSGEGFNDSALGALQGSSERKDQQRGPGLGVQPTPRLLQLANLVKPAASGMASFGSFASSGQSAASRPASSQLLSRKPALPLLPGMGAPTASTASAVPARTYYTEGEIFGTTFMYTTNMMFWAGIVGAVAFRRNLIILLLSAETVMLACNMNFLFTAAYLNDITGAIMSITITTIAACETAIGLALCVAYFHMRSATDVEALNLLK